MSRVEKIEAEIQQMSSEELAGFRAWFAEFDAESWDRQFESDVRGGSLTSWRPMRFEITGPDVRQSFDPLRSA